MLRIYETSLEVIQLVAPVIARIERRDGDLGRQMRRALASVSLNIAEGSYARGKNRNALYHVALGSSQEVRACIEVASAFGYIDVGVVDARVFAGLRSIGAVLFRLVT